MKEQASIKRNKESKEDRKLWSRDSVRPENETSKKPSEESNPLWTESQLFWPKKIM